MQSFLKVVFGSIASEPANGTLRPQERFMRGTAIEFRLRVVFMVAAITLGFWAPWIEAWGMGRRIPLLVWLALKLSRPGGMQFGTAIPLVIGTGALMAALGAALRIWGTAYLGTVKVNHMERKAGTVMAEGPYRYLRNPLYLGSWCMFAAMALLMPVSGAVFAIAVLTVFLLRLILGEEAFLASQLGEPYRAYLRAVPRLFPRLRPSLPSAGARPHWLLAVLAEINPIGVFVTLAFLSWSYDNLLMIKAIIVSFGVSLVVRALLPGERPAASLAE
jgi:protein-S-isoprenylcysteine O-methyltransferase Ste14